MKAKILLSVVFCFLLFDLVAQNRWNLEYDGSISWTVRDGDAHSDNIEMSGRFVSLIASYGVDETGRPIVSPSSLL
jgi:hypothetical protein